MSTEDDSTEDERAAVVLEQVESMLQQNEDVRQTYDALLARGQSAEEAKLELARALLGCLWEVWHKHPDRWDDVLKGLRDGQSTDELFPDALYDKSAKGNA